MQQRLRHREEEQEDDELMGIPVYTVIEHAPPGLRGSRVLVFTQWSRARLHIMAAVPNLQEKDIVKENAFFERPIGISLELVVGTLQD